jgi:hypothetical protein
MTTEAQIRVAEADRRELDARVATEIMGWKRGRPERGEYPWRRPDGSWHPSHVVPGYTSDPAADYEVLCHVRETWDGPKQAAMMERLTTMWAERSAEYLRWLAYMPGDYSRAALAVMEGE